MNENLPQKYKNSIFYKFFRKIKNLFFKSNTQHINSTNNIASNKEENGLENLKVDVVIDTTDIQKKEFMRDLSEHPELLENFSNDRLKIILQYYQDENERKRKMLEDLQS